MFHETYISKGVLYINSISNLKQLHVNDDRD